MILSKENGYTSKELQILDWCMDLAHSQGMYGRLLKELMNNKEALEYLAKQDFKDILDFVMFIEC